MDVYVWAKSSLDQTSKMLKYISGRDRTKKQKQFCGRGRLATFQLLFNFHEHPVLVGAQ
jgi:hypothetical protein